MLTGGTIGGGGHSGFPLAQAAGSQSGRITTGGAVIGKITAPVERVAEVIEASGKLAARVTALVDRIAGAAPGPQNACVSQLGQPGVLGGLVTSADGAQAQIANANDALDRLARAFGL